MMTALKSLAFEIPARICAVYVLAVVLGMIRHHRSILEPTGSEDMYTLAAMFGAAAGAALTAAITTEAVGYVVLLIPNRIREIKEEGRREERAEVRREIRSRIARLRARYERGEITLDEFLERLSDVFDDRCEVCGRSG